MRGDAPVAPLDDSDRRRDQLLGLDIERTLRKRRMVDLPERLVHLRIRMTQFAMQRASVLHHPAPVATSARIRAYQT